MVVDAPREKSCGQQRSNSRSKGASRRRLSLIWGSIALVSLLWPAIALAQDSSPVQSDRVIRSNRRIIIRQSPHILRQPPIIILPYPRPIPEAQPVRVEFDAQGTEWGSVYLDNRLIYRPHNFDRQETLYLPPGGYRLEITGVVRSDVWASGYLDLGRDSSRLVVIRFSKTEGVTVSGSPYVWIPD
ncbi:hypothetical protein [Nodosilinea sp. E11]|uniref:hypothetical protein n=1 Tax=Nodosilinea sp. E11 TaxID=3037479 RepID=UPI0029342F56|nr:hypothetical protein [Nodosilinea sp. E11]WOD41453.1 hypothetical protein RRF56_11675 [Nodosilinea sp. E11]